MYKKAHRKLEEIRRKKEDRELNEENPKEDKIEEPKLMEDEGLLNFAAFPHQLKTQDKTKRATGKIKHD